MKSLVIFLALSLLLALSASLGVAQQPTADPFSRHIAPGAFVFIEPMEGFEDYLMAAFHTKQVPVVVVTDKSKADFIVTGHARSSSREPNHVEATIKALNKDGEVIFAYAYDDTYAIHGKQSAAEACAKNLKQEVVGHK